MEREEELKQSIDRLNKTESKLVDLKGNFLRGIIYGFGFFIGGTLLVALLLYVLSFFNTAPVVGGYIENVLNAIHLK